MKPMNIFKTIFSLTRVQNLFIICLTLLLARYSVIRPILNLSGLTSGITDQLYSLMVFSVLLIAAGGYVINDYHDTGIDAINKPGKNKVGTRLSRTSTLVIYIVLTLLGLAGAFVFGHISGMRYAGIVFAFCAGFLYFYSSSYKKMFLVGNLIISLLTSITLMLSILFDKPALSVEPIITLISAYAIFAFVMTLIREIIKDCEDIEGDSVFGATTLPVLAGTKTARLITTLLCIGVFCSILYIQVLQSQWENTISFVYIIIFIQLPVLVLAYLSAKAKTKSQYHFNSNLSKIIMLTGVLSMLIFYLSSY